MNPPRPAVCVGSRYEFYATMQQEYLPAAERIRNYTGQSVKVIAVNFGPESDDWMDRESERVFQVRADDGREFDALEGELNGWFRDTGQYFWPDGTWGPGREQLRIQED